MKYPVLIEKDGNGYLATFPDIPEALTGGDTEQEVLTEAMGALLTAFEFYFEDQRPIPTPSAPGRTFVEVPASTWAKVLLLNSMLTAGISQSELARRLGTTKQEMQRIVDLGHATKIDRIAEAVQALGKSLVIDIKENAA